MSFFNRRPKILVPDSVLSPSAHEADLLQTVVTYVNRMRDEGCYTANDLRKQSLGAYAADYYFAQVCNGGHRQFAHNSRMEKLTIERAVETLETVGLTQMATSLRSLVEQGEKADFSTLDQDFMSQREDYYPAMNGWLRPHLDAVPANGYETALMALLRRDAKRQQRFEDKAALRVQQLSEDKLRVGFGLAALRAGSGLVHIFGGSPVSILGETFYQFPMRLADQRIVYGLKPAGVSAIYREKLPNRIEDFSKFVEQVKSESISDDTQVSELVGLARQQRIGIKTTMLVKGRIDPANIFSIIALPNEEAGVPAGVSAFHVQLMDGKTLTVLTGKKKCGAYLDGSSGEPEMIGTEKQSQLERRIKQLEARIKEG